MAGKTGTSGKIDRHRGPMGPRGCGLALNLMGVIVLFRYGIPCRVQTEGNTGNARTEGDTGSATVLDVEHHNLGLFGLGAVLIGTAFQIIGAIVPH
jgi:hypothetical protein